MVSVTANREEGKNIEANSEVSEVVNLGSTARISLLKGFELTYQPLEFIFVRTYTYLL